MDDSTVFARLRQSAPPPNACFLGPSVVQIPNGISIGSAVFAQITAESRYTLQQAAHFPFKIPPSLGGSGPPSNTWFLGPTRVLIHTAFRSVHPFLQGSLM